MVIFIWILIIFAVIAFIACCCFFVKGVSNKENTVIYSCIAGAVCSLLVIGSLLFFLYGTEYGARAIKDFNSNVSGGISRTVQVYDINGKLIKEYEGKFDVDYDAERIKFDDENGKRHIIYYTTGTILIDEN